MLMRGTAISVIKYPRSRGASFRRLQIMSIIALLNSLTLADGYSTSTLTANRSPLMTARCKGVCPCKFVWSTFAPFSSNSLHVSPHPFTAAWLNGVKSNVSCLLISAPAWRSLISTLFWPLLAAMCSAVDPPVDSMISISALCRNRHSTHSRFPPPEAMWRDVHPA